MPDRIKRAPSPSMAVALLALFVALGGTAVAAKVMITSSKQIKDGVVSRADIRRSAVDSGKVANGSLGLVDLSEDAKGSVAEGGTQALEAFRKAGPAGVAAGKKQTVATLTGLPAGVYALFAKTVLTAEQATDDLLGQGEAIGGHCVLDASGDSDESRSLLGTPGANSPGEIMMQLTRTFSSTGSARVVCDVSTATWRASDTSIIALRVGSSPRQSVEGR